MPTLTETPPLAPVGTGYVIPAWVAGADLSVATERWLLALGVPLRRRDGAPCWDVGQLPAAIRVLLVLAAETRGPA